VWRRRRGLEAAGLWEPISAYYVETGECDPFVRDIVDQWIFASEEEEEEREQARMRAPAHTRRA